MEFALTGHWLSVNTHLFIYSLTIFFCTSSRPSSRNNPRKTGHSSYTHRGLSRRKAAKQKRHWSCQCCDSQMHEEETPPSRDIGKEKQRPQDEDELTSEGGEKGSSRQTDQEGQRHGRWESIVGRARSIKGLETIRRQEGEEKKMKQGLTQESRRVWARLKAGTLS